MIKLKLFELRKLFRKCYRLRKQYMKGDRFDIINSSAISWLDSNFIKLDFHNTDKTKELVNHELFDEIITTLNETINESLKDIKEDWCDLYARGRLATAKSLKQEIRIMLGDKIDNTEKVQRK